jgi:site-specific recombinase XerD
VAGRHAALERGLAPATVSGYLRPLNTLCHYLVRKGALPANPLAQTVDPLIPRVEDAPLRLADLELDPAHPTLRIRQPKNGRTWELRLTARALPALRAYLEVARPALAAGHARHGTADQGFVFLADPRPHGGQAPLPGGQLSESGLCQLLSRRWRAAGGGGGFGWHRLRHGLGTELGAHGASLAEIAARLNHRSICSTARHVHHAAAHVAALVEGSAWAALDAALDAARATPRGGDARLGPQGPRHGRPSRTGPARSVGT